MYLKWCHKAFCNCYSTAATKKKTISTIPLKDILVQQQPACWHRSSFNESFIL